MNLGKEEERPLPRPSAPVEATWRIGADDYETLAEYLLYWRHLFAYEAACLKARTWAVAVDVGCGLGIGVPLLGRHGARVISIDMASEALRGLPSNVRRLQADAARIPLADRCVDLLVSFQLIEHVPADTAVRIVAEIRRVLRPGGFGFLTTPNARWRLLPGQRPWNPYHVREYRPREIVRLCRRAGLESSAVLGVVGRHGAQAVEIARVRQNPLVVYGGRYGARIHRLLRQFAPRWHRPLPLDPDGSVTTQHRARDWFELSPDYANGLDFWIEVRGK